MRKNVDGLSRQEEVVRGEIEKVSEQIDMQEEREKTIDVLQIL